MLIWQRYTPYLKTTNAVPYVYINGAFRKLTACIYTEFPIAIADIAIAGKSIAG